MKDVLGFGFVLIFGYNVRWIYLKTYIERMRGLFVLFVERLYDVFVSELQ